MKTLFTILFYFLFYSFTYAQTPTITSFSPSSGSIGTLVTIAGINLGNPTAFSIGGANAIVVSNTGTTLVGLVMPNAITGAITVTTNGGNAMSNGNFIVASTPYPSLQQGSKLVGIGAVGTAEQGFSVSLSADGNTAIVGGWLDNNAVGAAWIYTRSGGAWSQQGNKLVGIGAIGTSEQGYSVSLSADGNTAIVGGYNDNNSAGAAWVYTRSGSVWTQQGDKLNGAGAIGNYVYQGCSVSLSGDGNTAIVGGYFDNSASGAAWIFTRSGGIWTQQGSKLVGTGAKGASEQGYSVSLSADGNTAVAGGIWDNSNTGASWIYTLSGGIWTQQGSKLVGSDAVGAAFQGCSISLSADGNTAIVGGYQDSSLTGAAWVYIRSGGAWTQQGSKLVGAGAIGAAEQGYSVSLSGDGNTAILGGAYDNNNTGATWVYTRSGGVWTQQGNKLVVTGTVGSFVNQDWSVSISSDGSTTIVGGKRDNSSVGAAWVFVPCMGPNTIASATTGASSICSSATTSLTANGVNGTNEVLTWWTGTGGTGTNLGSANPLTNQPAGTYFARVTGDCGFPVEVSVTVVAANAPAIPIAIAGSGATSSQIMANWDTVPGAIDYFLDVSSDSSFGIGNFVPGFDSLNVGNIISQNVTGLIAGTTYYYRIRANDSCGASANSNTIVYATTGNIFTGANVIASQNLSLIYPNPAGHELIIETLNTIPKRIIITDALGRTIIQFSPHSTKTTIDIHLLSAGLYFDKVQFANGNTEVKKFVKE